jgi:hypothetical protein
MQVFSRLSAEIFDILYHGILKASIYGLEGEPFKVLGGGKKPIHIHPILKYFEGYLESKKGM